MVFALALAAGIWWWIGQSKMGYTFHAVICQPIVMATSFWNYCRRCRYSDENRSKCRNGISWNGSSWSKYSSR